MLYSELHKLTKGRCTQAEYDAINAVYTESDEMTKQEAARLWSRLFAKRHARREAEKKALQK